MLPPARPSTALILGLGGGTVAHLLARRWGPGRIVGVERDLPVLETARAAGWLAIPGLEIVHGDAFAYVESCQDRFGYVAVDLYQGERFDGRALNKPFLRRVQEILEPRGWLALNLFRDRHVGSRVERLKRVFPSVEEILAGSNVVLQARRER